MQKRNEEFCTTFIFILYLNFRKFYFSVDILVLLLSITFYSLCILNKRKIEQKRGQHQLVLSILKCFYIKKCTISEQDIPTSYTFGCFYRPIVLVKFHCETLTEIKYEKYLHSEYLQTWLKKKTRSH